MTDQYLQFGAPDYGGFTTEEEIARRMAMTPGSLGSPAIGARIEARRARARPQEYLTDSPTASPAISPSPQPSQDDIPNTRAPELARKVSAPTRSVASALRDLCASRPESLIDWIIIFIIIVALVCMFENAPDVISRVFRGSAMTRAQDGYCAECRGVID